MEKDFLKHFKQHGKTLNGQPATWKQLAEYFNIVNERRARTLGERANGMPTPPEGFRIVRGSFTSTGGVSYSFKEEPEPVDYESVFKNLVKVIPTITVDQTPKDTTEVINISDVHIGMSTKGGIYDLHWNLKELYARLDTIIAHTSQTNIILNMLGDYADGERNRTASNSHYLQQNLSDAEIFEEGLRAMIYLIDGLVLKSSGTIHVNWLSNSNHPTVVDKNIGTALKLITELRYPSVTVSIYDAAFQIIDILGKPVIFTHGKDRKFMHRGLPRLLPDAHINRLHTLLDYNNIKRAYLLRGDLHQFHHIQYTRITDIMTPSLCPPSGWVSVNFMSHYTGGYVRLDQDLNARHYEFTTT